MSCLEHTRPLRHPQSGGENDQSLQDALDATVTQRDQVDGVDHKRQDDERDDDGEDDGHAVASYGDTTPITRGRLGGGVLGAPLAIGRAQILFGRVFVAAGEIADSIISRASRFFPC